MNAASIYVKFESHHGQWPDHIEGPFVWVESIGTIIAGCREDGQEAEEIGGINGNGTWDAGPAGSDRRQYDRWTMYTKQAAVPCVVVIRDGVVYDHVLCDDSEHAERVFLDKLAERLSNWDEYDADQRQAVLDNGYEEFGSGSVCLSWAMSPDADDAAEQKIVRPDKIIEVPEPE